MYSHPGEAVPVHSVRSLTPRLVEARWPWGSGDLPLTSTFSAGEKKNTFFVYKGLAGESHTVWYFGFGAVFYFFNYLWSGWFGPLVPTETPSDRTGWPLTESYTIDHWPKVRAVSKVAQLTNRGAPSDICTRGSQGSVCQIEQFLNSSAFREAEAMGTVGVCPLLRCNVAPVA